MTPTDEEEPSELDRFSGGTGGDRTGAGNFNGDKSLPPGDAEGDEGEKLEDAIVDTIEGGRWIVRSELVDALTEAIGDAGELDGLADLVDDVGVDVRLTGEIDRFKWAGGIVYGENGGIDFINDDDDDDDDDDEGLWLLLSTAPPAGADVFAFSGAVLCVVVVTAVAFVAAGVILVGLVPATVVFAIFLVGPTKFGVLTRTCPSVVVARDPPSLSTIASAINSA